MSAKRFLITFALAALLAATGCRTYCERHYPCPTPAPATCCMPCAPTAAYAPPAPVQTWSSPAPVAGRRQLNCVCSE